MVVAVTSVRNAHFFSLTASSPVYFLSRLMAGTITRDLPATTARLISQSMPACQRSSFRSRGSAGGSFDSPGGAAVAAATSEQISLRSVSSSISCFGLSRATTEITPSDSSSMKRIGNARFAPGPEAAGRS